MSDVTTEVPAAVVPPKAVRKPRKAAAKKKVAAKKAPAKKKTDADRSKLVAKTWKDPKVAKARAQRNGVKADGKDFKSVREAFASLRLPMGQHISFRGKLKKAKRLTFETETGRKVPFVLVTD